MDLSALVSNVKNQALGSIEQYVFDQATSQNLVDSVLKGLVEAAVDRVQVEIPMLGSVGGALGGLLGSVFGAAQSLGLDAQIATLLREQGVDAEVKRRVIAGLVRYLEENGERLMGVAFDALVAKVSPRGA